MSLGPKTSYFTVTVNFWALGLQLKLTDTRAPTILEIQEGAIPEFNKAYRALDIRPFDDLICSGRNSELRSYAEEDELEVARQSGLTAHRTDRQ